MTQHHPRRFELVRTEDVSDTSGTGVVAVGVAYPDGAVHMQWRNAENDDLDTDSNGVAFKPAPDGVGATVEIHGHGGRTVIRWIDAHPCPAKDDILECEECGETYSQLQGQQCPLCME
jgi:hypothetical protein